MKSPLISPWDEELYNGVLFWLALLACSNSDRSDLSKDEKVLTTNIFLFMCVYNCCFFSLMLLFWKWCFYLFLFFNLPESQYWSISFYHVLNSVQYWVLLDSISYHFSFLSTLSYQSNLLILHPSNGSLKGLILCFMKDQTLLLFRACPINIK